MRVSRLIAQILVALTAFGAAVAQAQTTAGSGTIVVIPTAANISVYATEVFVRNPNSTAITLNVRYYQSNDASPPTGLRSCTQISVPANTSLSFDLGSTCALNDGLDNFGMIFLEDSASPKVNPFFAYSRTQTPTGIGFSVEGFPIGNFSGAPANVLGLRRTAAAPQYRSNCFIASLGESVTYLIRLWQGGVSPETPIGDPITGTLGPYETHRILDVFGAATNGDTTTDYTNVRANFTNSAGDGAGFIAFCTLETTANGSADFRIAKSDNAWDNRQSRLACYGMDSCGNDFSSAAEPATITDTTKRNIHYLIIDQPDFVKCDLVSDQTVSRLNDLQMVLRPPSDTPTGTTPFANPNPPYNAAPYTSGGPGQTSFYIYTGEKGAINGGVATRWYIDVSFRAGGNTTTPIKYGIKCTSGNGVTVPWFSISAS